MLKYGNVWESMGKYGGVWEIMTNNEQLEDFCEKLVVYRATTKKSSYTRCIANYESQLLNLLDHFNLVTIHEGLVNNGFLINYVWFCQIVAKLKSPKQSEIKRAVDPKENSPNDSANSSGNKTKTEERRAFQRKMPRLSDFQAESERLSREAQSEPSETTKKLIEKLKAKNKENQEKDRES